MLHILEEILSNSSSGIKNNESTFLSVIGRSYDEDLISRIVAYCLAKDTSLIKKLIERYVHKHLNDQALIDISSIKDVLVCPEKAMGLGRADIFVSLTDANNQMITLTIENKIYSYEHMTGDQYQTQVYYDWVTQQPMYADAINIFYYLRPDYNYSVAQCAAFENLSYIDMLGMLSACDDVIIRDFATHINYALRGDTMTFDPAEKLLLNNYKAFEEKRAEATKKVKAYQDMLIQKIVDRLDLVIVDWRKLQLEGKPDFLCEKDHYGAGIGSYRLYKENWYKENEHYFYVEIKFEFGCMDQIFFQCTLRDDEKGKHDHSVPKFLYNNPDIKIAEIDGKYHVIEKQPFFVEDWGSPAWETQFVEAAVQYLKSYMVRMDQVFAEYQNFKTTEM